MYRIYLLTEDGKFIAEDIVNEDIAKDLTLQYNNKILDAVYFYQKV